VDRELTDREQGVLDWMLTVNPVDAAAHRMQAPNVRVRGGCDCGCPTINFVENGSLGSPLPVTASVRGVAAEVVLFSIGGQLTSLEYTAYDHEAPTEFPAPELLSVTRAE
jgi:hypothetical protein